MKIHQLSLFLQNQPGQLVGPCRTLAEAGVDIRTLTVADTEQFGILRLIVSDYQRAASALRDAGYVINITEVVAVEVPDRPGGLSEVITMIEGSAVNIEYMYAFPFGHEGKAVLIFRFGDPDAAIAVLASKGVPVLTGDVILKG